MQHFGAEIREFGGLVERDRLHRMRIGDERGIAGEHAIHIGPDFDFIRLQGSADKGSGEIRSAGPKSGRNAVFGRAIMASKITAELSPRKERRI